MVLKNRILATLLLPVLIHPLLVFSHGVGLEIDRQEATVIRLHHDDGTPLADASYELSRGGKDLPYQSGQTDASGRVVFIADDAGQWHLRVFSQDGHGIDERFDVNPNLAQPRRENQAVSGLTKMVLGIGILFSGFGLMMLFVKRSKP